MKCQTVLPLETICSILRDPDVARLSTTTIIKPKPGDVYVFGQGVLQSNKDADDLSWRHRGTHRMPKANPTILKSYYVQQVQQNITSFCRHTCELTDMSTGNVLVQYLDKKRCAVIVEVKVEDNNDGQPPDAKVCFSKLLYCYINLQMEGIAYCIQICCLICLGNAI